MALVAAVLIALAGVLHAHEVRPAIADVEVGAERLSMDIRLTAEAMVAGIDLAGLDDTNDSPLSGYYDQLRAMEPDALRAAFDRAWPRIREGLRIEVEGVPVAAQFADLRIPEVGDTDLPRDSFLTVTAALPPGEAPVQVGWLAAYGPLVLRQVGPGENELYTGYLQGGALSDPLPRTGVAQVGALTYFGRYVGLGFTHILPKGLDHILFVLGLFFFALRLRPLLVQISAFTVAHTVTLALAVLEIVTVPAAVVEPLIAASIVYIAVENTLWSRMSPLRTAVVFGFGLLHGLGFASILGEIGLDPARFLGGLIGFNVGVELGQLTILALAYLMVAVWFGDRPWYRARIAVPASLVIAATGGWWLVERTLL
ncbi:HupE/UreJ family protein [Rhodovulum iodosum]|nr:HupE/UreJ family protein [Rhodovulum robiginosum]